MQAYRLRQHELTWRDVGDATVVLDLSDSTYLSVTGAGRIIWKALERGATIEQLTEAVLEMFEVDTDTARRDTLAFVEQLRARKLIVG